MAQLGDLARAKALLRKCGARLWSERGRGPRAVCRRRGRDRTRFARPRLARKGARGERGRRSTAHGDRVNAAHARNLAVRRLLLIGRLDEAERTLAELDPTSLPPASRVAHELAVAGIAIRRLQTKAARAALARAEHAARARRTSPR